MPDRRPPVPPAVPRVVTPQPPAAAVQRHAAVAPHVAAAIQRTMKAPTAAHVAAAVQPKAGPAAHVAAAMQRTMKAPAAAHVAAAVQPKAGPAAHVAAAMQRTMKAPAAAHVAAAVQPKAGPAAHVAAAMQRTMKAPAAAHVAAAVQPKAGPAPHVAAAMQRGVGAVQRAIAPVQRAGARVATPAIQRRARGVVQCCLYCGDVFCHAGEKCARQSLFPPGSDSVGVKYYNQKGGHEGKPTEWEHVVPGASYRSAGMGGSYRSAPVIQIPKSVHRGGVSGCGGGISSTGSSASATVYSGGIGGQLGVSFAAALRSALADQLNAAFVNDALNIDLINALFRLIALHVERGDISQAEAGELQQFVMTSYINRMERPDLYGGKK